MLPMNDELTELKKEGHAPDWMSQEGYDILKKGYMLPGENPRQMYLRVAEAAAGYYSDSEKWKIKFFDAMWWNYLCPASPVLSNMGTTRGLPISCNSIHVGDSIDSIFMKNHELAMLSKNGAGVGIYLGDVRGRGLKVKGNGPSEGIIPWAKIYDITTNSVSQGCYDDQTEILTNKGWMFFHDIPKCTDILVAQSSDRGEISFVKHTDYIEYEVKEELYHITDDIQSVNLLVTGNHRLAVEKEKGVSFERRESRNFSNERYHTGRLEVINAEDFIPHVDNRIWVAARGYLGKNELLTDLDKFKIAYQADGSTKLSGNSTGSNSGNKTLVFHMTQERKIQKLLEIVESLGWNYTMGENSTVVVRVPLEVSISKKLSEMFSIENFSQSYAWQFVEEIVYWDDSLNNISYSSALEENVDFIQMVAFISGRMSNKSLPKIKEDHHQDRYRIYVSDISSVGGQDLKKVKQYYEGKVYCVSVPSSLLVVRRFGRVAICGNSTRKGASALYLPIDHPDIEEFINIRRPTGDINRRCLNTNHGICINDHWMQEMLDGDPKKRALWQEILKARVETGEPYLFFSDSVNRQSPECYKANKLDVKTSNICFSGETRILTNKGYLKLKDLWEQQGSHEFSDFSNGAHIGNVQMVNSTGVVHTTPVYRTSVCSDLFRVTLSNGLSIEATSEHNFILHDETRVKLKDLKVGDALKRYSNVVDSFGKYHDPDYALLAGMVIGCGSISIEKKSNQQRAHVRVWNRDITECAEVLQSALQKLNLFRADVKSVLGQTLGEDGLSPGHKHAVPLRIWDGDRLTISSFLRGVFSADGSVQTKEGGRYVSISIRLEQKSHSLLDEIALLLNQFGIGTKIRTAHRKVTYPMNDGEGGLKEYSRSTLYELIIPSRTNCQIFMDNIGFIQDTKNKKALNWLKDHPGSNNSHTVSPIEVVDVSFSGRAETFCLTEPLHNEVTVAGVHVGNCSEITLYTDTDHSFVCCLSSLNLVKWDEWKDTDVVETTVRFLDAVLEEYIRKSEGVPNFEASRRSAQKGRAIGIGVLGWHTLLQRRNLPFDSFESMMLNAEIFKSMRERAENESTRMAKELGEPEWCKGYDRRNTHCVTGDTYILTSDGQVQISSVVGKEVDVWNGYEWSQVVPFKVDGGKRKVYKVTFTNGVELKCSDKHRFIVMTPAKSNLIEGGYKSVEVELLRLRVGDCMPKFFGAVAGSSTESLPNAYTSGFFTGDGNDSSDTSSLNDHRKQLRLYYGKTVCKDRIKWKSNGLWETWGHEELRGYVTDEILPRYTVPLEYDIPSRLEWLAGLLDSDGSSSTSKGATITTVHRDFAQKVGLLVQSLGGTISITPVNRSGGFKAGVYYSINLNMHTITILLDLGLRCSRLELKGGKFGLGHLSLNHWVEVSSIVECQEHEETYCFIEPKRNNGIFNGILTKQCIAIAPTVSNSAISGGHSAGIEPIAANFYVSKSAKGAFIRKNPELQKLLEEKGKDTPEVWKSINAQQGSVQHLGFLSEHEKKVFLTARELNQFALVKQAAQRQKWVDQAQSLNLFFAANASPKYIHEVHVEAWKNGVKTLYYLRTEGVIRGDLGTRSSAECSACES